MSASERHEMLIVMRNPRVAMVESVSATPKDGRLRECEVGFSVVFRAEASFGRGEADGYCFWHS